MSENKNEKSKRVVSVFLCVIIALLSFASGFIVNSLIRGKKAKLASDLVYLMDSVACVVDPVTGEIREITEQDIADALVNGLLDDYSAFYTKEEYKSVSANDNGNYKGFGFAFYKSNTNAEPVLDVVTGNSPMDRAGIKVGDKLVSASVSGGELVSFSTVKDVMNFFASCSDNDTVTVNYSRQSVQHSAVVKKQNYVASYVTYYDSEKAYRFLSNDGSTPKGVESVNDYMPIADASVGYIKLDLFEGDAEKQMGEALEFMNARGRTNLVLDLRNNGGGLMTVLTDIAEYFIDNGGSKKSLVAFAQGKNKNESFYTNKNRYENFIQNISIIGNELTASASECLIGALVYYQACPIFRVVVEKDSSGNARTYGKGIMQTTYQFLSGGAFKLTTARILWPDKTTCIHGVGVTPAMGAVWAEKGNGLNVAISLFSSDNY